MPRSVVGLDIGSTAVRAVEVRAGRTATVRRTGRVPLAPGVVEGGQVRQPEELTAALKELWSTHGFRERAVRLGVGSAAVLVRQAELQWMPPQDLKKALRFMVSDLLPVPVEQANLDHVLLGEVERPDPAAPDDPSRNQRMVKVLLVATAREGVDETVRCVRAAGLRPVTADLTPLALVRAARALAPAGDQTQAVIDIGDDKVAVSVHTDGVPHFVRVVPGIGGRSLTRALVDATDLEWLQAEALKTSVGLPSTPDGRTDPGVAEVLLHATRHLLGEVRESLSFYAASEPERQPVLAHLVGAVAALPGLPQLAAEVLGIPAAPLALDVAVGGGASRRRTATSAEPEMLVPFGLCLGGVA